MLPILDEVIRTQLASRSGGAGLFRRVLKITGRSESDVDATAQPVYGKFLEQDIPIATTILAVSGQIELHLSAQCASRDQADAVLSPAVASLRACLGESIYSVDGRSIEALVGDLLRGRSLTLALAESCTGGLLASRLTDVPGSSAFMMGGFVCYSNRSKIEWLGVPEALIAEHGAVSEPVAQAMAAGARERAAAAIGVGITGIAGPDGGTPEKPVGTVAIAISASLDAGGDRVRLFTLRGGRELVKFQSATAALDMLRLQLG
jgi:nicotinamide-nucleotide amidase